MRMVVTLIRFYSSNARRKPYAHVACISGGIRLLRYVWRCAGRVHGAARQRPSGHRIPEVALLCSKVVIHARSCARCVRQVPIMIARLMQLILAAMLVASTLARFGPDAEAAQSPANSW